jgi:hypothetical protein
MPTKNPRIHVVLEAPLFQRLKNLSKKNGLSMSLEAREIIRQAFYSPEKRSMRPYTGKHIKGLVGKLKIGRAGLDDVLATQVHG